MQPPLTLILGALFVILAIVNPFLVIKRGRNKNAVSTARMRRLQAHRLIGYVFILIYGVMSYYMVLRLKGLGDELSPRNLFHALLALTLLPLLLAKVVIARYYKTQIVALRILGLSIAGISYTLVVINLGAYLLRSASPTSLPASASFVAIALFSAVLITLFWRRPRQLPALTDGSVSSNGVSEKTGVVLELSRIERQTPDAKTLRFVLPVGHHMSFRPGQFLTFNWTIEGKAFPRCYSICSSPLQTGYVEITPKRTANGHVSIFLNDKASIGLTVGVSGPAGQFCFDEAEHRRIVLIAGGSGITPFMSMLRYIDDRCLSTDVTLLYFVRTRHDIIFEAELKGLEDRLPHFQLVTVLSQPDSSWMGLTGHLSKDLIEINVDDPRSSAFFICGPPAMMQAARDLLESLKVEPEQIKQESFGAGLATRFNNENQTSQMALVEFARSKQARMASTSATLLEIAEAGGIQLPYGCREGQCGTCATKLLKGRVRMQSENGLTPELKQTGYVLLCVSRPQGDVTIDA